MNNLFLILILIICLVQIKVKANNYTYICLETEQNFCVGISPGDALPTAADEFKLQLKNRLRNEDNNQAWKKTRFDISNENGTIKMANFELYLAQKPRSGSVFLLEEPSFFNLSSFTNNINQEGVIKLTDSDDCLTVMQCNELDNGQREFCNPNTNKEVRFADDLQTGAYLRFRSCTYSFSQIFRQRLDCADDCAPVDIGDGVCNVACNNTMCDFDHGDCIPKDETLAPTYIITNTISPTNGPTWSPTNEPTNDPTWAPTTFPTSEPIYVSPAPTPQQEIETTTFSPTLSPTEPSGMKINNTVLGIVIGLLFIMAICCCTGFIIYRMESKEEKKEQEEERPLRESTGSSQESFTGAPQIGYIHIEVPEEEEEEEKRPSPKQKKDATENESKVEIFLDPEEEKR